MSAERLRQAAAKVRETAEAAGPYGRTSQQSQDAAYALMAPEDAAHVLLWSPPVALAVADWLDAEADCLDASADLLYDGPEGWHITITTGPQALALADLILGAES